MEKGCSMTMSTIRPVQRTSYKLIHAFIVLYLPCIIWLGDLLLNYADIKDFICLWMAILNNPNNVQQALKILGCYVEKVTHVQLLSTTFQLSANGSGMPRSSPSGVTKSSNWLPENVPHRPHISPL